MEVLLILRIKFIQKIIDKCRKKNQKDVYIELIAPKIITIEKVLSDIDTIILGSSHPQLGYLAKPNEFNLGMSLQDLYYSYKLCEKYENEKIKKIILFYSVFSAGNQRIMTRFANACVFYKVIAGIDYQDKKIALEKKLHKLEKEYARQYKDYKKTHSLNIAYRGNELTYETCPKPQLPADRAKDHYKDNIRNNNQTKYVEKIFNLTNEHNQEFIIVLPPVTKGYKDALPKSSVLFKDLITLANRLSLKIVNLYDSDIFDDSDFVDYDHLNYKGAIKLTNYINKHKF